MAGVLQDNGRLRRPLVKARPRIALLSVRVSLLARFLRAPRLELELGLEPMIQVAPVFSAALHVNLVGAQLNLFLGRLVHVG